MDDDGIEVGGSKRVMVRKSTEEIMMVGGWGKKCNINVGDQHVGCDNDKKEEERGW